MALAVLGPTTADSRPSPAPGAGTTATADTFLALLRTRGKVPAAALLAGEESGTRYAESGPGISRSDRFRAGSATKTFLATGILQLAFERPLSERAGSERRSRPATLVRVKQCAVPPGRPHARDRGGPATARCREPYNGTMSGAPSRAASAVRSSGCRCDSRSASTRFS